MEPLPEHRLSVTFNDGFTGIYAVDRSRRGGVFLRLLAPDVFNAVSINPDFGCIEWPGGIDLCPTTMREELANSLQKIEPRALREKNRD